MFNFGNFMYFRSQGASKEKLIRNSFLKPFIIFLSTQGHKKLFSLFSSNSNCLTNFKFFSRFTFPKYHSFGLQNHFSMNFISAFFIVSIKRFVLFVISSILFPRVRLYGNLFINISLIITFSKYLVVI